MAGTLAEAKGADKIRKLQEEAEKKKEEEEEDLYQRIVNSKLEYDLLYDDAALSVIREEYPDVGVDYGAKDGIHQDRVGIMLPEVSTVEFYKFAIRKGFIGVLLGFNIHAMRSKKLSKELLAYARSLKK